MDASWVERRRLFRWAPWSRLLRGRAQPIFVWSPCASISDCCCSAGTALDRSLSKCFLCKGKFTFSCIEFCIYFYHHTIHHLTNMQERFTAWRCLLKTITLCLLLRRPQYINRHCTWQKTEIDLSLLILFVCFPAVLQLRRWPDERSNFASTRTLVNHIVSNAENIAVNSI